MANLVKWIYGALGRLFPQRAAPTNPQNIVLILPCCIGDVVLATATLSALRDAYPHARITWAVGKWSHAAIARHPALTDTRIIDDQPLYRPGKLWRFIRQLRGGNYDLAVSLVRSPVMSLAVWLAAIPYRAGIDSDGRGFGYNLRAPINPLAARHEADVYLSVVRQLGIDPTGYQANVPVKAELVAQFQALGRYFVINPAGGSNPGMLMDAKRWLPDSFATLANRLAATLNAQVVLIAGPQDGAIVQAVQTRLDTESKAFVGVLSFEEIAALAAHAIVYIGNDTGLTHLAAATGAKTIMILGPSDPIRYAPYAPNAAAVWKPTRLKQGGVAFGAPDDWDWQRDGVSVKEVYQQVYHLLGTPPPDPHAI